MGGERVVGALLHRKAFMRRRMIRALVHEAHGEHLHADAHLVHCADARIDVGHRRHDRLGALRRLRPHRRRELHAFGRPGEYRMRLRMLVDVRHDDVRVDVDEAAGDAR